MGCLELTYYKRSRIRAVYGEYGSMGSYIPADTENDFRLRPRGKSSIAGNSDNVLNNDRLDQSKLLLLLYSFREYLPDERMGISRGYFGRL